MADTRFKKGEGGRPKGSRNKFPKASKEAVAALLRKFGSNTALIEAVILAGLKARPPASFPYLRLIVEQQVGLPDQEVNVRTVVQHVYETLTDAR